MKRLKSWQKNLIFAAVVLAAAWFAAPHVLDWATHTWYLSLIHI